VVVHLHCHQPLHAAVPRCVAKLETTSAGDTTAQRKVKEDSSSGSGGTGGSSDDSSNGDASSTGRDKGIGGGGKEGVLT
jgi:hypothetical protein